MIRISCLTPRRGWAAPVGRLERLQMRLLIAIFLPWLLFFTIGRPFAGIICLILQVTLIGWIPAALWAIYALSEYKSDTKIECVFRGR